MTHLVSVRVELVIEGASSDAEAHDRALDAMYNPESPGYSVNDLEVLDVELTDD